ncbi:hypothetical protein CLAFUW4_09969 [Fulvia fulva]|uniref:Uncharacterized protein n=1 Tax=Passalora fulva TaxID=5499 RepID=A0A9Q8UUF2_PASFU|nr:uncharacterized protein CLAFUR5_12274 [Fulvia fulva]KAK4615560.1 hypothetical protein CLAFUR4_09973 [Fulvia fulva]KAK4616717.1 hypothetical protein CLAFUR0_09970 [Fulvia fulva]UJO22884.1 hypothetical protein CLAFUR5_12274 [Fulvia fulva]WPV19097.1 hypothetical protein CLAFUW4_09969 [Fulvia fulva]WPV34684.1 hypothetical protein CLAFUW7_09970 [Fulvia fulva]
MVRINPFLCAELQEGLLELTDNYFLNEEDADMSSDRFFTAGDFDELANHTAVEAIWSTELDAGEDPQQPQDAVETNTTIHDDTTQDPQRHIFQFFELPGELRNHIYDDCLTDKALGPSTISGVQIIARDTTPTNLLTISKQFQHELTARQPQCKTALITKHISLDIGLDLTDFTIPTALPEFENIVIPIYSDVETFWADFKLLKPGLASLLPQLASKQKVSVCWVVTGTRPSGKSWAGIKWRRIFRQTKSALRRRKVSKGVEVYVCWGKKRVEEEDEKVLFEMDETKIQWSSETDEMEELWK